MGIFTTQCKVCSSPHRSVVDAKLAAGGSLREIARQFGFSVSGLHRHSQRCFVEGAAESDNSGRQLEDAAKRLLAACERKGDRKGQLDALKLLNEMRVRRRISSASASTPASAERPHEGKSKDPADFIAKLKRIYGLEKWKVSATIVEHVWSNDERLVEALRWFVDRRADSDPTSAAIATKLASRILGRALDQQTEREIARLEAAEDDDVQGMVGEVSDTEDEAGADDERAEPSDEREPEPPELDNDAEPDGIERDVNGEPIEE